ncbi:thiol-disulfide oxidoreductase DCC family protein [Cytobacillus firmus]|uniref:thiol-disulfide oxidoreductase DCC family protein n=1 Tax=Cytobacillus TaxID=2675230 RepID=UPI001C2297C0|nr:thiol-disulfide oxidoreductase DCC family protein [Cytobacillus oceanisediminis]MBU8729177.1 thiol-disulfide oxidoreductase DCC family protein [Cytobacillus oceanisediminis]MCM3242650.1 thiol-disulfide oxidoreductase DCC family protein [Cytobacillus oceanisediminis]MCS0822738.1 thiol-disulfide oxidoreductase DCC family protein [Cytobacillus firmus]
MERIILFDGECNFCDQSVQFIIKRDPRGHFKFAALQSYSGKELLNKHNAPPDKDSFVLIEDNNCYYKSSAALRVCKNLEGAWKIPYVLLVIPKPIRDFFYGLIAKNRYKWFGKKESCMLPSPEERKRFL